MSHPDYQQMYEDLLARHTEYVQTIYDRQQRENEEKFSDYMIVMADGTIHENVTNLKSALNEIRGVDEGDAPEVLSIRHRWLTPFKEITLTKE